MSEKNLKQIGEKAALFYAAHKDGAENIEIQQGKLDAMSDSLTKDDPEYKRKEQLVRDLKSQDSVINMDAADFAKENAGQLHDLAVIEAHLGGTAIQVEQPVVIGQKVDVHVQK